MRWSLKLPRLDYSGADHRKYQSSASLASWNVANIYHCLLSLGSLSLVAWYFRGWDQHTSSYDISCVRNYMTNPYRWFGDVVHFWHKDHCRLVTVGTQSTNFQPHENPFVKHALCSVPRLYHLTYTGLILGLRLANVRRRYKVTPSLIGWAQT